MASLNYDFSPARRSRENVFLRNQVHAEHTASNHEVSVATLGDMYQDGASSRSVRPTSHERILVTTLLKLRRAKMEDIMSQKR
jgi:hypothetical protein